MNDQGIKQTGEKDLDLLLYQWLRRVRLWYLLIFLQAYRALSKVVSVGGHPLLRAIGTFLNILFLNNAANSE